MKIPKGPQGPPKRRGKNETAKMSALSGAIT